MNGASMTEAITSGPAAEAVHETSPARVSRAIYGLITVMAVLQVMEIHPPTAWQGALSLFGTTLAVALADAYSDYIAEMIAGRRRLTRQVVRAIGRSAVPILTGAQPPTFLLLASALGFLSVETAITLAQVVAVALLFGFGLRAGQHLHESWTRRLMSGLVLVAIGGLVVGLKAAFH